jgi:hypothetical protein
MVREMSREIKAQKRAPQRIEIFVDQIEQLFNSMDPSPFQERDLDHDAEEFIVSWAREYAHRDRFTLVVHVNQPPTGFPQELVEEAVRNYFAYRAQLTAMEFKRLLKQGRTSLIIGLLFLAGCFLLREFLLRQTDEALLRFVRESLTIAGWVAMWRPMQIFLYDWWPLRHLGKIYERLSRMPVELKLKKESLPPA